MKTVKQSQGRYISEYNTVSPDRRIITAHPHLDFRAAVIVHSPVHGYRFLGMSKPKIDDAQGWSLVNNELSGKPSYTLIKKARELLDKSRIKPDSMYILSDNLKNNVVPEAYRSKAEIQLIIPDNPIVVHVVCRVMAFDRCMSVRGLAKSDRSVTSQLINAEPLEGERMLIETGCASWVRKNAYTQLAHTLKKWPDMYEKVDKHETNDGILSDLPTNEAIEQIIAYQYGVDWQMYHGLFPEQDTYIHDLRIKPEDMKTLPRNLTRF